MGVLTPKPPLATPLFISMSIKLESLEHLSWNGMLQSLAAVHFTIIFWSPPKAPETSVFVSEYTDPGRERLQFYMEWRYKKTRLPLRLHITHLSRSCYTHIRNLRRIRPMLDLKTASTIATSAVHAKLDYCNSLLLNIDITQINRLQAIQNALARTDTISLKHHHITPVLKSLPGSKYLNEENISFRSLGLSHWKRFWLVCTARSAI